MVIADRIGELNLHEADPNAGIAQAFRVSQADFEALKSVQLGGRTRQAWDLAFNVGAHGEIFPVTRSGHTPESERAYSRGTLDALDRVADAAVEARGVNGRFFVNENGVFYKDRNSNLKQCLRFEMEKSA